MNKKTIYNIKVIRLIIAILIIFTIVVYYISDNVFGYYKFPDENLIMATWVSLFVLLIGVQYKLENKNKHLSNFLLLFSIMMLIANILGFMS